MRNEGFLVQRWAEKRAPRFKAATTFVNPREGF
jgi:hypothetical protein